jgi:hypothetical protein
MGCSLCRISVLADSNNVESRTGSKITETFYNNRLATVSQLKNLDHEFVLCG